MRPLIISTASIAALVMLTACGSDGTTGAPTDPGPPEMRTGGQILHDGESLAAHHTTAIRRHLGKRFGFKWDELIVRRADAETAVVDVNGETYELPIKDDEEFAADNFRVDYEGIGDDGEWYADVGLYFAHPENAQHMVIAYVASGDPTWRGYAVAGNRSQHFDGMGTGTATYDSDLHSRLEVFKGDNGIWSRNRDTYWSDDGHLVADFDAMTISGQLEKWGNNDGIVEGMIATLEAAPITADGFTGAFRVTGAGADWDGSALDASYEGSFYGPGAEDVAGVFSGTYTRSGGRLDPVIGYFVAEQADE